MFGDLQKPAILKLLKLFLGVAAINLRAGLVRMIVDFCAKYKVNRLVFCRLSSGARPSQLHCSTA